MGRGGRGNRDDGDSYFSSPRSRSHQRCGKVTVPWPAVGRAMPLAFIRAFTRLRYGAPMATRVLLTDRYRAHLAAFRAGRGLARQFRAELRPGGRRRALSARAARAGTGSRPASSSIRCRPWSTGSSRSAGWSRRSSTPARRCSSTCTASGTIWRAGRGDDARFELTDFDAGRASAADRHRARPARPPPARRRRSPSARAATPPTPIRSRRCAGSASLTTAAITAPSIPGRARCRSIRRRSTHFDAAASPKFR